MSICTQLYNCWSVLPRPNTPFDGEETPYCSSRREESSCWSVCYIDKGGRGEEGGGGRVRPESCRQCWPLGPTVTQHKHKARDKREDRRSPPSSPLIGALRAVELTQLADRGRTVGGRGWWVAWVVIVRDVDVGDGWRWHVCGAKLCCLLSQ